MTATALPARLTFADACAVHAKRLDEPDGKWGAQTVERMR